MSADLSALGGGLPAARARAGAVNIGGMRARAGAVAGGQDGWQSATSPGALGSGAKLRKVTPAPKPNETAEVVFAFNPEKITLSHTYSNDSSQASTLEDQIKKLGYLEISLSKLYLIGDSTKSMAETLIKWSCPVPTAVPCGNGKQVKSEPADLRFSWGTGLTWKVRLRSVTIVYLRFAPGTFKPIRAEVSLGLYSSLASQLPPPQNPTSGGLAGRSAHVLDSSECLASLAAANYDRPGAWRRIASANAIDDPLRVAPGTTIYLPEPGELGDGTS